MYVQIVKNLECDWPQTLRDWDKLEKEIKSITSDVGVERIDDCFPEPAAAIKLANQFNITSILPSAFYHLSRISILDDWDQTHADPSISIRNTKRTARWDQLSAKDFHRLLLGKAKIASFLRGCINTRDLRHIHTTSGMMGFGVDGTTKRHKNEYCEVGEGLWKNILDRCLQSADPLTLLRTWIEEGTARDCDTCTNTLKAKIPAVRAQIWEKLRGLFHLKDERALIDVN